MAETNNLLILTFSGVDLAKSAYDEIERLEEEKKLVVADAIIIERDAGATSIITTPSTGGSAPASSGIHTTAPTDSFRVVQTHGKKGKFARRGGGLGLLAGWLLGGPIGGLVVGATIGALAAALKDFGIDDKNVDAIKARLQPDTSALLILGHVDDRGAFLASLRTFEPQVVSSSLPPEAEKQLRESLGTS